MVLEAEVPVPNDSWNEVESGNGLMTSFRSSFWIFLTLELEEDGDGKEKWVRRRNRRSLGVEVKVMDIGLGEPKKKTPLLKV